MQTSTVSPFNWRVSTTREEKAATPKAARPMSARARAERILAHRWGNPYCKPGAPRG